MMNETPLAQHELFIQMSVLDEYACCYSCMNANGQEIFLKKIITFFAVQFFVGKVLSREIQYWSKLFFAGSKHRFYDKSLPKSEEMKASREAEPAEAVESPEEGFSLQDDACLTTDVASCQRLRLWTPSVRRFASHTPKKGRQYGR